MTAAARLDLSLVDALEQLERDALLRRPRPPTVRPLVELCSNDYLGLRRHPALAAAACAAAQHFGTGSGASRLVGSEPEIVPQVESRLAGWMRTERALLFPTGWHANVGVLTALAGPGDAIFSDALNHASLIDGARLSRAERHVFAHNDVEALDKALSACTAAGRRLIVVESIFSMDGDDAPLHDLAAVAARHGAHLIVDEAHALGVVGPDGRGLVAAHGLEQAVSVRVGTLGKAFGASGAFVACTDVMRLWLWNRARTFVFTTGLSPAVAGAIDAALDLVRAGLLQADLAARIAHFCRALERVGLAPAAPAGAIVPIVVGEAAKAVALSRALEDRGFLVTAIRPPTVPAGTSRLRITLRADLSLATIDTFADTLAACVAEFGAGRAEPR